LLASHFWVNIYLNLKAELLDNKEQVNEASPSVIPDNQPSFKEGITQISKASMVARFLLISFSLKEERKVKNLAFLVGNTIFPLNNKQIKKRFLVS
jgi:hypothetical protein